MSTCPISELHELWRAPWYPVARAIAETGHDVLVADPDATEAREWWDENQNHGAITVVPHPGLAWVITVVECEPDVEYD